ncbi:MAG: quinone-dependent dihydroorotate dehydrogenase [Opitutales bacterium]
MGSIYETVLRPVFFRQEAEEAHELALQWLDRLTNLPPLVKLMVRTATPRHARPVRAFGLTFPNAIGLAAGFDKEAAVWPALMALGFGHVEVGTVTRFAQNGNEKPRVFRYPGQEALINRMGFPNDGADSVASRLQFWRERYPNLPPVGVNIGKSRNASLDEAVDDYLSSFRLLAPLADYVAINVSSPNTPNLRSLQAKEALNELLAALQNENAGDSRKPLLLKIAPDLSFRQIDEALEVCLHHEIDGIIATNTTLQRPVKLDGGDETGGLSGRPLHARAVEIVRYIHGATKGQLPIVGVGGVSGEVSAGRMADVGATLVQLYTGLVYKGPWIARRLANTFSWHQRPWA